MSHPFNQIAPTDKFGWHKALLPVYAKLFERIRGTLRAVGEIGCDGGGGILMYADYFKFAHIAISCDISPKPESLNSHDRVSFIQADAYNPDTLRTLSTFGPYALLVDDGPHTIESQRFFCANYPKILSTDGIAIVEDIQDPKHIALLADAVPKEFDTMAIDVRHVTGRYDDVIFCIFR